MTWLQLLTNAYKLCDGLITTHVKATWEGSSNTQGADVTMTTIKGGVEEKEKKKKIA